MTRACGSVAAVCGSVEIVQDRLRLDCQVMVHPGDPEGPLKGHGQSSFDAKQGVPWELKHFRERAVDVAKGMASEHARAFAVKNARLMKEHGYTSEGLLTASDVPAAPENVHTPGDAPTCSF